MLFLVYRITNLLNNKIYIGAHQTNKLNDNYLGSGRLIKLDVKKFGRPNFKKDILFVFDNKADMLLKEKELVTKEFCMREDTYNQVEGGAHTYFETAGLVPCKDKNGNFILVYKEDPRYLSGELVHVTSDTATVKDKDGKIFRVSINDERYLSGELVGQTKGKGVYKDKLGNVFSVSNDDNRIKTGELIGVNKGIKAWWPAPIKGQHHSEDSKKKIGLANSFKQKGAGNSQFGSVWISNGKEAKKIKKDSEIPIGWYKGRK